MDNKNLKKRGTSCDAFNTSCKLVASPPMSINSQASANLEKLVLQKYTKTTSVVCYKCNGKDQSMKLLCSTCRRWWHHRCLTKEYRKEQIVDGKVICDDCDPDVRDVNQNDSEVVDVENIVESADKFEDVHIRDGEALPPNLTQQFHKDQIGQNSTSVEILNKQTSSDFPNEVQIHTEQHIDTANKIIKHIKPSAPPNKSYLTGTIPKVANKTTDFQRLNTEAEQDTRKSTSSRHSHRSGATQKSIQSLMAQEIEIQKQELEIKLQQLQLEKLLIKTRREQLELESLDSKSLQYERQRAVMNNEQPLKSMHNRIPSNSNELKTFQIEDERQSVEKCREWMNQSREVSRKVNISRSKPLQFLRHDVSANEFLNATLGESYGVLEVDLTQAQTRARQVMSKELPVFSGDPKAWPQFISRFTTTTRQCGFSADENIERLSRCLKGEAYEAVKADLLNPKLLPNILYTLKSLYGRPEIVFNSLVQDVRNAAMVKLEKINTLIVFSMRIKAHCETARAAGIDGNLNNPSLLAEFISKLSPILQYEWASHHRTLERRGDTVNVEIFDEWLQDRADCVTVLVNSAVDSNVNTNERRKSSTKREFYQGIHGSTVEICCQYCKASGHDISTCPKFASCSISKRWYVVRDKGWCVKCLKEGHFIRDCKDNGKCKVDNCMQPHHSLLHSSSKKSNSTCECQCKLNSTIVNQNESGIEQGIQSVDKHINVHIQKRGIMFQIIPVMLSNGLDKQIETYAFLDSGSEITLIEEKILNEIGVNGPQQKLRLKWTGDTFREEIDSQIVNLQISGTQTANCFKIKKARTVKKLDLPSQTIDSGILERYPHLSTLPLQNYENIRPTILIGIDNFQLLTPLEIIEGKFDEPVAIKTRLGWSLFGKFDGVTTDLVVNNHLIVDNSQLENTMREFFTFENLGVKCPQKIVESNEDARARRIMQTTTKRDNQGRYEVGLLWKTDDITLPNSYNMARKRLHCLQKKMIRDKKLGQEINRQIQEYKLLGYLEKLNCGEIVDPSRKIWYLPIFPVINPNKPEKVRLVWDAAAEVNGVSLNNCLLSGPDMLTNLPSILYKFREYPFAISGDIEKMFHQVKIRDEDQDAQRCLWQDEENDEISVYRMTVMTFGATCSPVLAQHVKNSHASTYSNTCPRAVEAIVMRHYVDDYLDSFPTFEECVNIVREVIQIHQEAGFHIRDFISNDKRVLQTLPKNEITEKNVCEKLNGETKVLGMWWFPAKDELRYRINESRLGEKVMNFVEIPTKRAVLRVVMSIFDPMGLLSYLIVQGKLIVKDIWRSGIEWDDQIREAENLKWKIWVEALRKINEIAIPRWYFKAVGFESYELHVFVDASEEAMAAVAYVVRAFKNVRDVALVAAKTKLNPNKPISIPRLELQAAVIGARLCNSLSNELSISINKKVLWTDSRNVICWIRSPRRFKIYVAHRIGEILETTKVDDWKWVPTAKNIADVATKSKSFINGAPKNWFKGPDFLSEPMSYWPLEPKDLPSLNLDELELRCNLVKVETVKWIVPTISRFSAYKKLIRTQAYVLRFIQKQWYKGKVIDVEELASAEKYLIKAIQWECFANEVNELAAVGTVNSNSALRTYSPFLDSAGVIRMKSRLEYADYLTFDQRFPIILPPKHRFTALLIDSFHQKYRHQNHHTVLNEIRQKFAIPSLRAQLKTIRRNCQKCRIDNSRPNTPEMAALPRSRLAANLKPFTFTGIDYFGPLLVKVGRRVEKRWCSLFTCLTTRAIHLETTSTLSSNGFMLALQCFVGRRGTPREIFTDNGTNFRGANNELRQILQQHISDGMEEKFSSVKWHFNPPHAPHMGGAWERLVRSVKAGLFAILKDVHPTDELLRAVLAEVEMMVNSRPLTYVSCDKGDLEALTPNHFLLGSSSGTKPWGDFTDDSRVLRCEWRKQQVICAQFWKRWTTEYLPEVSKRTKWYDRVENLKIGDVVAIVHNEHSYSWQ